MKVNLQGLQNLVNRIESSPLKSELMQIPKSKAIAALVGQAIADNFDKEGPDWQPLSAAYLKIRIAKSLKKEDRLQRTADRAATSSDRNAPKRRARALEQLAKMKQEPTHMILQKTGLLKKAATTPGAPGNIWRTEGTTIVWGTDLAYAAIHNRGGTIAWPGTSNGFGKGIKIGPHPIKIPKREFLRVRAEWMAQIAEISLRQAKSILTKYLETRNA